MNGQTDILANYRETIKFDELDRIRRERTAAIRRDFWAEHLSLIEKLPKKKVDVKLGSDEIRIGSREDLTPGEHQMLSRVIETLIPWRKGPFEIFGHRIDAEWQSNRKWDRIAGEIPPLEGKAVADFGCGNAYYLFRLLGLARSRAESPACLLGLDPSERFFLAFQLVQRFLQEDRLQFELLGVEHAGLFRELFDLVLCLGVIYHQRDPLTMLQELKGSMRPGAKLILESQAIAGEEPSALFVPDRYAKARNVYFIPTASCLAAWAARAGFEDVRLVSFEKVTTQEQRRTELAPYESLADFLDPHDSSRTVEGFPAPYRAVVVATKP